MIASNTDRLGMLSAAIDDIRDELRRIDAKARDLMVVVTLAVTIAAAAIGFVHTRPPTTTTVLYLLAALCCAASTIHLIIAIRPVLIPTPTDLPSRNAWLNYRWQVLSTIATTKYARVRRAVDLLLTATAIALLATAIWLMTLLV